MTRPAASKAIEDAVRVLVDARRSGQLLEALPPASRPGNVDEAHAIQDATVVALADAVTGWKVLPPIEGRIARGILLRSRVFPSPATLPAARVPLLGVEAEIAFRFDRDLSPRATAYEYEEVAEAVTAMAAIEVVDSRFRDYRGTALLDRLADCASNGAFVAGTLQPRWRAFDLVNAEVELSIDGHSIVRRVGGHAAVDPLLPAVALVNALAQKAGVRQGQVMTTGSYTGLNFARPGQTVVATFNGFGSAEVHFAS
jgi:2-keto-4-pentenoate hydratase